MEKKNQIELTDLIPEESEITLYVNKAPRVCKLRPFSLSDRVWVSRKYGDRVQEIFSNMVMEDICAIIYHQLYDADKEFFCAQEVTFFDDDGEKQVKRLTGPQVLMSCISGGPIAEIRIVEALMKCIGVSEPLLTEEEEKKISDAEAKKKAKPAIKRQKRTGQKSLTL